MSNAESALPELVERLEQEAIRCRSTQAWSALEEQTKRALARIAQAKTDEWQARQVVRLYFAAALGNGRDVLSSSPTAASNDFQHKVEAFRLWVNKQPRHLQEAASLSFDAHRLLLTAQREGSTMSLARVGSALRTLGRPDLALQAVEALLTITRSRSNYYALTVRGAALIDLGRIDEGLAELHRAEKFGPKPNRAKTLTALSRGYRERFMSSGDLESGDKALEYARRSWQMLPSPHSANACLAAAHTVGNDSDIEDAQAALASLPGVMSRSTDTQDLVNFGEPWDEGPDDIQDSPTDAPSGTGHSTNEPVHKEQGPPASLSDERCLHELYVNQCASCKPVPAGPTRVFITAGGQVYHWTDACGALYAGWQYARNRGQETHPAVQVHVNDAIAKGLARCMICTEKPPSALRTRDRSPRP